MRPILFFIPTPWGDAPIFMYGVMLGLSLIVAWYFLMHYGHKLEGLQHELMANCFVITAVCSLLGARLLYVITQPHEFDTVLSVFQARGGMVAYGGFIGGAAACWAYMRYHKVPFLPWADIIAPVLGTGLLITRVGCWFAGCDFGKPLGEGAPAFLAKLGTFPEWDYSSRDMISGVQLNGSPAWRLHSQSQMSDVADHARTMHESLPVHPTQLYESLAGLVLFAVTFWVMKNRKFKGQAWLTICILYPIWRFVVEFWRDDPERGFAFGWSTSQLVSMVLLPLALYAWWKVKRYQEVHGPFEVPSSVRDPKWLEAHALAVPAGSKVNNPPNKAKRAGKSEATESSATDAPGTTAPASTKSKKKTKKKKKKR